MYFVNVSQHICLFFPVQVLCATIDNEAGVASTGAANNGGVPIVTATARDGDGDAPVGLEPPADVR